MNKNALTFLKENRIGVITTLLTNGAPHGATVHYAQGENPRRLIVLTERDSRKCSGLLEGDAKPASFVIGFVEKAATLQFDGVARLLTTEDEKASAHALYAQKFDREDKKKFLADPDAVFMEFVPSWWQFTDYSGSERVRELGTL
jgi:uncharacterized protein YhbP (UPF0306 family)